MLETPWRPARRLRHLESISVHNFFNPSASFDSTTEVLFDLLLLGEHGEDVLLFESEKILLDPHLEWDSINLRENSKLSPAILHQPFRNRLRVVVRAAPPQRSSSQTNSCRPQSPPYPHTPQSQCRLQHSKASPKPTHTHSPIINIPHPAGGTAHGWDGCTSLVDSSRKTVQAAGGGALSSPAATPSPTAVDAAAFPNSFQRSQLFGDTVGQLPGSSTEIGLTCSSCVSDITPPALDSVSPKTKTYPNTHVHTAVGSDAADHQDAAGTRNVACVSSLAGVEHDLITPDASDVVNLIKRIGSSTDGEEVGVGVGLVNSNDADIVQQDASAQAAAVESPGTGHATVDESHSQSVDVDRGLTNSKTKVNRTEGKPHDRCLTGDSSPPNRPQQAEKIDSTVSVLPDVLEPKVSVLPDVLEPTPGTPGTPRASTPAADATAAGCDGQVGEGQHGDQSDSVSEADRRLAVHSCHCEAQDATATVVSAATSGSADAHRGNACCTALEGLVGPSTAAGGGQPVEGPMHLSAAVAIGEESGIGVSGLQILSDLAGTDDAAVGSQAAPEVVAGSVADSAEMRRELNGDIAQVDGVVAVNDGDAAMIASANEEVGNVSQEEVGEGDSNPDIADDDAGDVEQEEVVVGVKAGSLPNGVEIVGQGELVLVDAKAGCGAAEVMNANAAGGGLGLLVVDDKTGSGIKGLLEVNQKEVAQAVDDKTGSDIEELMEINCEVAALVADDMTGNGAEHVEKVDYEEVAQEDITAVDATADTREELEADFLADKVLEEEVDVGKLIPLVPKVDDVLELAHQMLDRGEANTEDSLAKHSLLGQNACDEEGATEPRGACQPGDDGADGRQSVGLGAEASASITPGEGCSHGADPERGEVLMQADVDLNQLLFLGLDARRLNLNFITTNTLVLGMNDGFYTPRQPAPLSPTPETATADAETPTNELISQDIHSSSMGTKPADTDTAERSTAASTSRAQSPELSSPTHTSSPTRSGRGKPSLAQQQSFYRWMLSSGSIVSPLAPPTNNSWDAEFDNVVRVHMEQEAKRKHERGHTRSHSGSQLSSIDASPSRHQRPPRPSLLAGTSSTDVADGDPPQRPSTGSMLERQHDILDMRAGIRRLMEARQRLDVVLERRNNIRDKVFNLLESLSHPRQQQSSLQASAQQLGRLQRRLQRSRLKLDRLETQLRVRKDKVLREAGEVITCSQTLLGAVTRLCEAIQVLVGEQGWGAWKKLHAQLVAHRCRCVVQLAALFQIGPVTQSYLEPCSLLKRLDNQWWAGAGESSVHPPNSVPATSISATARQRGHGSAPADKPLPGPRTPLPAAQSPVTDVARLTIGGLELPSSLTRRGIEGSMGWSGEPDEEQRVAAGLGYTAQVVKMLGVLLDVPLRYPIRLCLSTSKILDGPLPLSLPALEEAKTQQRTPDWAARVKLLRRVRGSHQPPGTPAPSVLPASLPLHYDGADRTRFAYAIFLLNKDVEQLLSAHGLTSVGPSHVLHNLYNLVLVAASAVSELPPGWPPTQPALPISQTMSPTLSRRASADSSLSTASSAVGSQADLLPAPRQFSLFGGRHKRPAPHMSPDVPPRHKSATAQHTTQLQHRLLGSKPGGLPPEAIGLSSNSSAARGLLGRMPGNTTSAAYTQPYAQAYATRGAAALGNRAPKPGLRHAESLPGSQHHTPTTVSQGFWTQTSEPIQQPSPTFIASGAAPTPMPQWPFTNIRPQAPSRAPPTGQHSAHPSVSSPAPTSDMYSPQPSSSHPVQSHQVQSHQVPGTLLNQYSQGPSLHGHTSSGDSSSGNFHSTPTQQAGPGPLASPPFTHAPSQHYATNQTPSHNNSHPARPGPFTSPPLRPHSSQSHSTNQTPPPTNTPYPGAPTAPRPLASSQAAPPRRTSPFLALMHGPAFRLQGGSAGGARPHQPTPSQQQQQQQQQQQHHTFPSSKPHPNWR